MKRHTLRLALGVLALGVAFLVATIPVLAVVNGEPDDGRKPMFPNVGAIVITKTTSVLPIVEQVPQTISSGTLVHPQILLTAGHTVALIDELIETGGLSLDDFAVSFQFDAHDDSQRYIRVAAAMTHEEFIAISGRREPAIGPDVGVVILEKRVNVKPVELATVGLLDRAELSRRETPFAVVGYGAVLPSDGEFPPPQTSPFPLPDGRRRWAISTFDVLHTNYLFLSQKLAQGEGGMSTGDSGGPAFLSDGDGELVQVGVFSTMDNANTALAVFTRTDLDEVLEFVDGAIALVEGE